MANRISSMDAKIFKSMDAGVLLSIVEITKPDWNGKNSQATDIPRADHIGQEKAVSRMFVKPYCTACDYQKKTD